FFFFFQAEDGIRDLYVTGVQTCALPISICQSSDWIDEVDVVQPLQLPPAGIHESQRDRVVARQLSRNLERGRHRIAIPEVGSNRSEERRVGKECRYRWSRDQ